MSPSERKQPSKALSIALWIAQVLVAVLFGMAGFFKAILPIAELAVKIPWTPALPLPLVRFIGVAELAGAVGLLVPALTRIKPVLTPLAAAALALVMVLAVAFHAARGELGVALPINGLLGVLAAFVAWGRWKQAPIAPR